MAVARLYPNNGHGPVCCLTVRKSATTAYSQEVVEIAVGILQTHQRVTPINQAALL